jgi:hypothetical protein
MEREMTEWQPIETAPKDGTLVDVWVIGYSNEPKRFTDAWFSEGHWWYAEWAPDCEVHALDLNDEHTLPSEVTHWMPLPEPPK